MSDLSQKALRFIREYVDSVDLLAVLLFLRVRQPQPLRPDEISVELRSSTNAVRLRLRRLERSGFVTRRANGYYYSAGAGDDAAIAEIVEFVRTHRTSVIDAIYTSPDRC